MDLSIDYLGLKLSNPLMPGASPLPDDLDMVKRLEDAGAGAIVLRSLFEEQIQGEQLADIYHMEMYADSFAEAHSFFPKKDDYAMGPDQYLEHIRKIKKSCAVPIIASLNGTTLSGWLEYAKLMAQAGADALELNVYHMATDPQESSYALEHRLREVVREVRANVQIPLAVKLSPFFSSLANVCSELDNLGVDGIILFNRFYQPDIDIEGPEVVPTLKLSEPSELLLRLRWLAAISGFCKCSLGCSGGVHSAADAIKSIMCGAHGVQVVSALLKYGPQYLGAIKKEMSRWMEEHEYHSVRQMHGSMSLVRCPDPRAFERANYMRILQSWKGGPVMEMLDGANSAGGSGNV